LILLDRNGRAVRGRGSLQGEMCVTEQDL
jgi:hypothetical protein